MIAQNHRGDIAAIECRARRLEPDCTAAFGRGPLLINHILQTCGEIGLHENIADPGRLSAGQIDRGVA